MFDISNIPENAFVKILHRTFEQTSSEVFVEYLTRFTDVSKWMIVSDYYFNRTTINHVVVYTLIPYVMDPQEFKTTISNIINRDIKHVSSIKEDVIDILLSPMFLHIAFILPKSGYIFFGIKTRPLKIWAEMLSK